jgi:hypothetical protein
MGYRLRQNVGNGRRQGYDCLAVDLWTEHSETIPSFDQPELSEDDAVIELRVEKEANAPARPSGPGLQDFHDVNDLVVIVGLAAFGGGLGRLT